IYSAILLLSVDKHCRLISRSRQFFFWSVRISQLYTFYVSHFNDIHRGLLSITLNSQLNCMSTSREWLRLWQIGKIIKSIIQGVKSFVLVVQIGHGMLSKRYGKLRVRNFGISTYWLLRSPLLFQVPSRVQ